MKDLGLTQSIATHPDSGLVVQTFSPTLTLDPKYWSFHFFSLVCLWSSRQPASLTLHSLSAVTWYIGHYCLISQPINFIERLVGEPLQKSTTLNFSSRVFPLLLRCASLTTLFHSCHQKLEIQQYRLNLDFSITVCFSSLPSIPMGGKS